MVRDTDMRLRFVLNGFSPDKGFRLFNFQRIETLQGVRTESNFTVRTDLSLIRGYGIHMQDLPVLCRGLLERRADAEAVRHLTYTEEDMRSHQVCCDAARHAAKRSSYRKPVTQSGGSAWRTPGLLRTEPGHSAD